MKMSLSYDMQMVSRTGWLSPSALIGPEKDDRSYARKSAPPSRIVHVPRRFVSEEWGGTETVVLETCRQQQHAGSDPVIYTSMALSSRKEEMIQGVPVERFGYCYPFLGLSAEDKKALDKKGGNLLSLSLFAALLTAPDVRLFHAHTLKRVGGAVRTAARLRKKPLVVSLHGGIFDVPTAEFASLVKPIEGKWEWGKPFGALLGSRHVLNDADMILCVGANEFDKAKSQLSHDRIAHLPNGVDCAKFEQGNGRAFRVRFGLPHDAYVILNVSRIDEQKNQMMLLQAFAKFADARKDAHLVLIGPETMPAYATRLREFVASSGLNGRVHILPGMKNNDGALVDAYHGCDLFVLPSAHEPFGIVVLEAWSAGKPVIASDVGGLSKLVTADRTGLFVEPGAAEDLAAKILLLSGDNQLSGRLAQAGKQEALAKYDWSQIAVLQEQFYQQAEHNADRRYGRRSS